MTDTSQTRRALTFGAFALGLLLIVGVASNAEQFEATPASQSTRAAREIVAIERDLRVGSDSSSTESGREPIEIPQSIVIAISVALGVAGLYLLSRQRFTFRFNRPSVQLSTQSVTVTEEEQAEEIAEMARDLIEELNAGDSPRYAIQRAYAAVETGFGAPELARKPAETPRSYLTRIFGRNASLEQPLEQLTEHFQHARFSSEPVDETMRIEAIDALVHIRDHYTKTAWKRIDRKREARERRAKASR